MIYESTSETILKAIDHPSQASWQEEGRLIPTASQLNNISNRYPNGDTAFLNELHTTVGIASMRSDTYRSTHEATTLGILGLRDNGSGLNENRDYNLQLSHRSELDIYRSLAARPDKEVDFIKWFAKHGAAYYAANPLSIHKKLGVELGGKRQGGDWENTEPVDSMIRTIPSLISTIPGASIKILDSPEERVVAYRYEQQGKNFGLIRRRRAIADLALGQDIESDVVTPSMRIFKEALGLILLDYLPFDKQDVIKADIEEDDRRQASADRLRREGGSAGEENRVIRRNSIALGDFEGENNTPAARTAGKVFKAASQAPKGTSNDVVPISAHYVLIMDKPLPTM